MPQTRTKNRILGKYQLQEEIGSGGMATVYKATDLSLKRDVAVKVLHSHLVSHEEARTRFEREARAVARLKHESVVEVYDYDQTPEGDVFLVMELVNGITLREFLDAHDAEPLMSESAALIARKLFLALQVAHDEGIVHRDVKPENILIDTRGYIKLSDFGIAYLAGIGQMTTTGQILGSPTYMSPEHIESSEIDARADIFSVGTILYEMTVGSPPFVGNSPHQIIKRVVEGYYDNPLGVNPCVSDGISAIIVKCLQIKPELRFSTASEAAAALEAELRLSQISDFDEEQIKCIQNLEKWQQEITPSIINFTLEQGRKARMKHRLPEAMNHLNRVLAMDPGNETALGIVNVLSKKRRLRRSAERIGAVILIILIAAGLILIISNTGFKQKTEKHRSTLPPVIKSPAALNSHPVNIKNRHPHSPPDKPVKSIKDKNKPIATAAAKAPRGRKHPKVWVTEKTATREVMFVPHPMNVRVVIDGSNDFIYKISDRSRVLKTGDHSVTFIPADSRMLPLTRKFKLQKGDSPYTIRARLNWKPGILNVKSNTAAIVSAGGREIGVTNKPINLKIQKGPSEALKIMVSAKGYQPIQRQLNITAGETTVIQMNLKKSLLTAPSEK